MQQSLAMEASGAADQDLASCIQQVRAQAITGLFTARNPDGTPVPMAEWLQQEIDALTARRDALKAGLAPKQ
jgi:hypothetical protein